MTIMNESEFKKVIIKDKLRQKTEILRELEHRYDSLLNLSEFN
jgi:hypothetical protein